MSEVTALDFDLWKSIIKRQLKRKREHESDMPRKFKRSKRSRKHSKKGHRGRVVSLIPGLWNRGSGLPDRLVTKLRYDNVGLLTSTTGTVGKQVWRMNSIFDPDLTGGGHQPHYYDQFAVLYDHYTVIKSKIIHVMTPKENNTISMVVGTLDDDDGTTEATFATLMESPHARSRVLGLPAGGTDIITMKSKFDCKKDLGIDPWSGTDGVRTPVGSNPTEVWTNVAWNLSSDGATTGSVYLKSEIIFTVLFSELKTVATS